MLEKHSRLTRTAYVLALLFSPVFATAVQAELPYQVEWAVQFGTAEHDYGHSVALDSAGNIFITGQTEGSLGGPNAGRFDSFLTKFDPSGNVLWSSQVGSVGYDLSRSVAVDSVGNSYITGRVEIGEGGAGVGQYIAVLNKFDPTGNELWSKQIGTAPQDTTFAVAIDSADNTYITGSRRVHIPATDTSQYDVILYKLDPSGTELWNRQLGTARSDESFAVTVDEADNAYISGSTQSDFAGPHNGSYDAFLMKFDPSGTVLLSRQIGTRYQDKSTSVAVDRDNNIFISGGTEGDLGGENAGSFDIFLTKFDPAGVELWSRQIGTPGPESNPTIAVDSQGNTFVTSYIKGERPDQTAQFGDMLLTKFDPAGNELWSQVIGTPGFEDSRSVTVDGAGNVYITGVTSLNLAGPSAGSHDAVLVKFSPVTGDLNHDGFVGVGDLQMILGNWNQSVPTSIPSPDLNNDGFIGINDLNVILTNWNMYLPGHGPIPLPEPSTLAMLSLTGAACVQRKR